MLEIKIGSVLKEIIKEKRLSLKKISQDTEIPYSTLYTWFENRQPKDILKVQRLADYFGISLHYLLFAEEEKNIPYGSENLKGFDSEVLRGVFEVVIKKI